jgi:hypothetical protein
MSILSVAGCSRASDDGGTPVPDLSAANASEVTRFADEVPFGPDAIVSHDKTPVRKSPGNGEVVVTLPSGTDVVKLSMHGSEDLVCFDEPGGGRHLMGWVAQSALEAPTPPSTPPAPAPLAEDGEAPPSQPPDARAPHGGGHHHHPHRQHR